MQNVSRARIRGLEASVEGTLWGVSVKGSMAGQQPRDEDTGYLLQGRAERFGRLEASQAFGAWSISGGVTASSERFDSANEDPATRLPGYAIADATVRYVADRTGPSSWSPRTSSTSATSMPSATTPRGAASS